MPTAVVDVAYVNPPKEGKTRYTIKDRNGVLYSMPPQIAQYVYPNKQYRITYDEQEFQGNIYRVVKTAFPSDRAPNTGGVQSGSGNVSTGSVPVSAKYGNQDDKTAERIFVCGALNAMLGNPQFPPIDVTAENVTTMVNALRQAWARTLGGGAPPPISVPTSNVHHPKSATLAQTFDPELNDEIPAFE